MESTELDCIFQRPHQIGGPIDSSATNSAGKDSSLDFRKLFAEASSVTEASVSVSVSEGLVKRVAEILSLPDKPMHQLGLDSLVAVELRNWLAKEVGADVAIFKILGGAMLQGIGELAAGRSPFKLAAWAADD